MQVLSHTGILTTALQFNNEQVEFYQENRFIKLKQVFNNDTLQFFKEAITSQVNKMNTIDTAIEERSTYG